jgi:cytochrome o ubiquinol oxidase operon protein cyoD
MATTTPNDRFGLRFYLTGFALAALLTLVSFGLVAINALPRTPTLIIIAIAAVFQILVHLRYFLHLDPSSTPRWNLFAIAFASILIFIMVGGSLWIMFDLYNRMMV